MHQARLANGQCAVVGKGQSPDAPVAPVGLSGSVGAGGQNRAPDVLAVQSRLNSISAEAGGPLRPLAEDGISGSNTRAAILKFQRRYSPELVSDGRVDPDKNTWKKLISLTDGSEAAGAGGALPKVAAPGAGRRPNTPARDSAAVQTFLTAAMHFAQYRVIAAIQSLDQAGVELVQVQQFQILNSGIRPMTLHAAYTARLSSLVELPEVDRCFHLVHPRMTIAGVKDVLRRLQKVYRDMLDVIVKTIITTPKAEKSDVRRFVRTASDASLRRTHPPSGAIADAEVGGWWKKNANEAHIRYNDTYMSAPDICTTLLHEMSHFVSHASSYEIGPHHNSGLYQGAFNDTHHQAVRNSFCYEWFAMLAQFKFLRSKPNAALPNPL
ncbi:peptidoglycan hydrolase-like protein with peptidoglycan-binding domain [Devosia sp. UYZn731]|uniref:peptidoglycan-binding domain-containing protein n=1 Tax=Devosia sp. UYZn731 TaxID=3156345 RepID=UPI0033979076